MNKKIENEVNEIDLGNDYYLVFSRDEVEIINKHCCCVSDISKNNLEKILENINKFMKRLT